MTYRGTGVGSFRVEGAADSSFDDCKDTRRSAIGWGAWVGDMSKSGAVTWGSTMGKVIATSSTQAEVQAASALSKDIVWSRELMAQLGFEQPGGSRVHEDNNGCIGQVNANREVSKAKHYGRTLGYLGELVHNGSLHLVRIGTKDNPADMHTKALTRAVFEKHRDKFLGLHE